MGFTNRTCAAINDSTIETDDPFFDGNWDAHKIGWLIAGVCALVSMLVSGISFWMHARNYYKPKQQRQILRILLMPPVYAILSFFSYRYYTNYTYWEFGTVAYESLVLAAFLLLLLQFIGESNTEQRAILMEKEKHKIPFPFCFIRYRPSKPYFLHALKWSVLQYSFLRPAISIAGIITDYYGVLCPSGYSIYYAEVYLDAIDFVSISIALYGLIVFGALCRKQMTGQQPLAKFLSIKGIVMLTFYQGFVFDVLQDYGVIKATDYWTATNVSDGLQALCTCVEMVIFSVIFIWAFPWKQYKALRPVSGGRHTSFWRATFNSLNYADFVLEAWAGLVFLCNFIRRKPGTRASQTTGMNIEAAFSGEGDWKLDNGPEQISSPNMSRSSGVQAHGRGDGAYYGGGYAGEQAYPMEERGEYGEQQQQQQQQQQEYGGYHHERSVDGYGAEQGQQQGYGHEQGQQGYGHNQGQPGYGHNAYPSEDRDYYHR